MQREGGVGRGRVVTTVNNVPPARRRLFGTRLRRFRESAGFTLEDAAGILECDRSKISRIEAGQRGISHEDLSALLAAYAVPYSQRNALVAMVRHANQTGRWQPYSHVLDGAYQDFIGLEATADAIYTYEAQFIPSLLQTEAYARSIADASLVHASREVREQFVKVRLTQQEVLTREGNPLELWAVLSEGVLRQMVGGQEVMRAQLRHLIDTVRNKPNVNLQVVPFSAGAHTAVNGSFVLMRFPEGPELRVVYLEGETGGVYLESTQEIARYIEVFDHLRASALSTAATVRLMEEITSEPL